MTKVIKFSVIFFLIYIILICLQSIFTGDISLNWPDKTLVAPILSLKGYLQNDFHTNGYIDTPIINTAKIFSIFAPNESQNITSFFTNFSIIHRSLILILSLYLLATYSLLLIKNKLKLNNYSISKQHIIVFISSIIIYSVIKTNIFSNEIFGIFFGSRFAGVHFLDSVSHSRYISLSLSIISIAIPLSIELYGIILNKKKKYILFLISTILFLISIYFHPVAPLFIIPIGFFLPLILGRKNKLIFNWLKITLVNTIIWLFSSLSFLYFFPQKGIDSNTFFKIYIEDRHPHHYLVSDYMSSIYSLFFISINIALLLYLVFIEYKKNKFNSLVIKNISVGLSLFFLFHTIQFIFVDLFKVSLFMKLGISWLTVLFNFYYITTIIVFTSTALNKSQIINISKVNKYFNFKNIPLNSIIFILTLISFAILKLTYISNIAIINNSLEHKLGLIARDNNLDKNYEYIISEKLKNKFINAREFGLLNVYSDKYFPFNSSYFNEWYKRKYDQEKLLSCLKDIDKDYCHLDQKKIIYISNKEDIKIGNPILRTDLEIRDMSLYCKYKKNNSCIKKEEIYLTPISHK
tara:strand:- start:1852 stop:3585 length:1734 start_codon:yes stop_codon:yes gene_type:complete